MKNIFNFMVKRNIIYKTKELEKYYSKSRIKWQEFYNSERKVIGQLNLKNKKILDLGCACGGLGIALKKKFKKINYTGVEINKRSADRAKILNKSSKIINCDLLNLSKFLNEKFKFVFALSVIDFNVKYKLMLKKAWSFVNKGGYLICTFRLTNSKSAFEKKNSFQYINFSGLCKGEKAPYIVFNPSDLIREIKKLNCSKITAHGYWGEPNKTAVTPFKKIFFGAFLLKKSKKKLKKMQICLPKEIYKTK